jgi:sulfate adenylyltransferase subunit 1 (EFTu-like GTPase family)
LAALGAMKDARAPSGSVDHRKSTLIGRLLYEAGLISRIVMGGILLLSTLFGRYPFLKKLVLSDQFEALSRYRGRLSGDGEEPDFSLLLVLAAPRRSCGPA